MGCDNPREDFLPGPIELFRPINVDPGESRGCRAVHGDALGDQPFQGGGVVLISGPFLRQLLDFGEEEPPSVAGKPSDAEEGYRHLGGRDRLAHRQDPGFSGRDLLALGVDLLAHGEADFSGSFEAALQDVRMEEDVGVADDEGESEELFAAHPDRV